MKTLKLLMLALSLSACGSQTNYYINPVFTKYTNQFTYLTQVAVVTNVDFGQNPPYLDGVCTTKNGIKTIYINEVNWNRMNEGAREQLMLHELGHCVLGLKHDSRLQDGIPVSIMYPTTFGGMTYYSSNRQQYLEQYIDVSL